MNANETDFDPAALRSGYVAIVGRPNVGKSTLLNALVGEKLSIVSRKAQTTRHRIAGIRSDEDAQYVFVDTPGFQTQHKNALNRAMNRGVCAALVEVDVVVFVIEAGHFSRRDEAVLELLPPEKPVLLALNKTDLLPDRESLLPFLARIAKRRDFAAVVPVSAAKGMQKGGQLDSLLAELKKHLPREGLLFAPDEITDKSERFIASEYLREKLFRFLGDELPYGATVEIEKFEEEGGEEGSPRLRRIFAAVIVDRPAHKAMVIGKGGETLKRIASEARQDMERLFGGKVYLEVWVKVKSGWNDDERLLRSLGYE
ncbi:MAG: GTPase Era [Betaproteobacteria bacterium]|nr:GTPase Era [Betaproteobacteria bacterium]